jgi:cellulose biosynthesis protein BcsQ
MADQSDDKLKIVSFFNHKGGVGKTTIAFNVALAVANLGHRVLMIDADAQANLTAVALTEDRLEEVYDGGRTIWSALAPLVSGSGDIKSIRPTRVRGSVSLLAGDIRLSHFEAICPQGWTEALAGEVRGYRVSTAIYRLIRQAGGQVDADVAFIDLGPNVGALNRTALLASDGFVIPMAPDLFSVTALPSVGTSTAKWIRDWQVARATLSVPVDFDLPEGRPVPLGYLSQQFSVYRKEPSAAFRRWLKKIPEAYREGVLVPLESAGVSPPGDSPDLGALPNFYSLIPIAQDAKKAVFELGGSEARGAQFTRAQDTRTTFEGIGAEILRRLNKDES